MPTYAILIDQGPRRATAVAVTANQESAAASAGARRGDNWDLAFVPSETAEGERVWLSQCVTVHDVPAFVAQYGGA